MQSGQNAQEILVPERSLRNQVLLISVAACALSFISAGLSCPVGVLTVLGDAAKLFNGDLTRSFYTQAFRNDQHFVPVLIYRAEDEAKKENWLESRKYLDLALSIENHNERASFDHALTYVRAQPFVLPPAALEDLNASIRDKPANAAAHNNRACFLYNQNYISNRKVSTKEQVPVSDQALSDLNKSIELAPDRFEYRSNRALCLWNQARNEEALQDIMAVVRHCHAHRDSINRDVRMRFWSIAELIHSYAVTTKSRSRFYEGLSIEEREPDISQMDLDSDCASRSHYSDIFDDDTYLARFDDQYH